MKQWEMLGKVVVGAMITLVVASLVFRKFIGLELSCLVQLGYLSLLQNPDIKLPHLSITKWEYVFGYNQLYFS